jgi:glycosyltransferase involved in cell wall biosynthesis
MLKFSIITSCFNSEDYIAETIESVINQAKLIQNKCELEYIIIDGNSTDSTNSIIEKYKKLNPNIIHKIEDDNGLYDGLSKAFPLVTGDIMGYLNAGDFLSKTAFSTLSNVFVNDDINWVTGLKVLYNDSSEVIDVQVPYRYRPSLIRAGVYGKNLPFIQQESTFWRPKLLESVDIEYFKTLENSGDMYLWYCFSKENDLNIIHSYLSGFKYHPGQLTFKETGATDVYLKEAEKFIDRKSFKDYIFILLDSFFWSLGRNVKSLFSLLNGSYFRYSLSSKKWSTKAINNQSIDYVCWVCDFRQNNGEGIVGGLFLEEFTKKNKIPKQKVWLRNINSGIFLSNLNFENTKNNNDLNFLDRYFSPFLGIVYLWYNYLLNKKIVYVNFNPLWNFLIFLLLPPKTILGPITGSKDFNKRGVHGFEKFFRKYLMKIQFQISNFILKYRYKDLIFSTDNLMSFLSQKVKDKSSFNFAQRHIDIYKEEILDENQQKIIKDIDFIIYVRFYSSKGTEILMEYIEKLKDNFKIITVGDKSGIEGVKEYGFVDRKKVLALCKRSRFSILSTENFNSLFSYECIKSGVKVFFNKENEYNHDLVNLKKIYPINIYDVVESTKNIEHIANQP